MDAIRFDPSIGAELAIDRRHSGNGGDMFADMLGNQLKKRADSDGAEPAIRRRQPGEPRQNAGAQAPHGHPIRPVIKHPYTLRGEAKPVGEDRPLLEVRDRAHEPAVPCMDEEAGVDQAAQETGAATEASQAAQPDAVAAEAAPAISGAAVITAAPSAPMQPASTIESNASDDMADGAVDPQSIAPAEPAKELTAGELAAGELAAGELAAGELAAGELAAGELAAAEPAAAEPAAGDPVTAELAAGEPAAAEPAATEPATAPSADAAATPTAAGFAAALAASMDQTAAAMIGGGDTMADSDGAPQTLTTATLATLAGSPAPIAAGNAAHEFGNPAALTIKSTPEAPRPAETAKPRSPRAAPSAEIKAQPTVTAQSPQPQVASPAVAATQVADPAESTALPFDAAFVGDSVSAPGWTLHLAQGATGKRPDFIAQLRQHLQDLPAHEQVAVNIQRALREGTGRVSIQLSPAELGKIHVKLEIDEEKRVTAAVTVEKPSTLELLQRDVKALERALQDAGLKIDGNDLSFSLGRQDGKEFSQDLKHSGPAETGSGLGDKRAEAETPVAAMAEVNTAAGLVNLEI